MAVAHTVVPDWKKLSSGKRTRLRCLPRFSPDMRKKHSSAHSAPDLVGRAPNLRAHDSLPPSQTNSHSQKERQTHTERVALDALALEGSRFDAALGINLQRVRTKSRASFVSSDVFYITYLSLFVLGANLIFNHVWSHQKIHAATGLV